MASSAALPALLQIARVIENRVLCREHYRLTLRVDGLPPAQPGQFVHLNPPQAVHTPAYREFNWEERTPHDQWLSDLQMPLLRRAYSIAGLRRGAGGTEFEVIYRVVGAGTRWLASLHSGAEVSVLGPLGNAFPVRPDKPHAWLVAGGVGLPPMLWLAEALHAAGRQSIAFCGAQRGDLIALALDASVPLARDAALATLSATEFAAVHTPVVVSTDDGSVGFAGHIGQALAAYHHAHPLPPDQVVVYTCGPERMMRFVAEFAISHGMECHVCLERSMACGTGTCQSCVAAVHDPADAAGWRYRLCCTDGPVFDARAILWAPGGASGGGVQHCTQRGS